MLYQTSSSASIHPSIEGLVAMIAGGTTNSSEQNAKLRDLCVRKMRSYREDVYLKRYTTPIDLASARDRWQTVSAFANSAPAKVLPMVMPKVLSPKAMLPKALMPKALMKVQPTPKSR